MNILQNMTAKIDNMVEFVGPVPQLLSCLVVLLLPVFPEAVAATGCIRGRINADLRQCLLVMVRSDVVVLVADGRGVLYDEFGFEATLSRGILGLGVLFGLADGQVVRVPVLLPHHLKNNSYFIILLDDYQKQVLLRLSSPFFEFSISSAFLRETSLISLPGELGSRTISGKWVLLLLTLTLDCLLGVDLSRSWGRTIAGHRKTRHDGEGELGWEAVDYCSLLLLGVGAGVCRWGVWSADQCCYSQARPTLYAVWICSYSTIFSDLHVELTSFFLSTIILNIFIRLSFYSCTLCLSSTTLVSSLTAQGQLFCEICTLICNESSAPRNPYSQMLDTRVYLSQPQLSLLKYSDQNCFFTLMFGLFLLVSYRETMQVACSRMPSSLSIQTDMQSMPWCFQSAFTPEYPPGQTFNLQIELWDWKDSNNSYFLCYFARVKSVMTNQFVEGSGLIKLRTVFCFLLRSRIVTQFIFSAVYVQIVSPEQLSNPTLLSFLNLYSCCQQKLLNYLSLFKYCTQLG